MEKISEELLERLDLLAQKLGVTIDHLWRVLVRQAYIEVCYAIFWIILATFLTVLARYYIGKSIDTFKESSKCPGGRIITSIVLGFVAFIFLLTAMIQCIDIGYLFNPEYYALEQMKSIINIEK